MIPFVVLGLILILALLWKQKQSSNINALFNTAIDSLIICKYNGELIRANPYFYKLLGYNQAELDGKKLTDLIHPDDRDRTVIELSVLENGGTVYDFTNRYRTKDGQIVHLMWNACADPVAKRIYASARNITEKVRHEAQLKAVAYMASHDFAEPVRAIAQFSSLLLTKEGDKLSDKGRRWLEKNIGESASRLRALSDDLRDYLKSMRDEPKLQPIDLNESLKAAIALLNGQVEEKGAVFETADLCSVYGTPQLNQVLYNLLSNAIKYVKDNVPPKVLVSCENDGPWCIIHVKDNGIGFDPKFAESIFELGRRLFSSDSKYWGSGTGLAIVKLHVERMGGQVWAQSTPGEGSVFSVRLRRV